jgi:hypothetical protein
MDIYRFGLFWVDMGEEWGYVMWYIYMLIGVWFMMVKKVDWSVRCDRYIIVAWDGGCEYYYWGAVVDLGLVRMVKIGVNGEDGIIFSYYYVVWCYIYC